MQRDVEPREVSAKGVERERNGSTRLPRRSGAPHSGDQIDETFQQSMTLAQLGSLLPGLRLLIGMVIATIVIATLYFGRGLLIPLALAALLGFLLDPLVTRLKRWGVPRTLGVILVVACALGVVGGIGVYVTNQLTGLSADLPTYQNTIRTKLRNLRKAAMHPSGWDGALKTLETVQHEIEVPDTTSSPSPSKPQQVEVVETAAKPMQVAMEWLGRVSEPVATAGIVLLFVILILLDRRDLRDRLLRASGGDLHVATDAMDEASERIGRYLRMQFLVNVSYGIPMGIGLWLIGVPAAPLWGFVAAVMRFVPYVGTVVSAIFPLALAFAVAPDWSMVLWTLALIGVLELLCANVAEPWLYGSSTGMTPLSIIVAATFWTALWGPIGLILSTPLTVCLLVLGRYLPALHFMEVLLGDDDALDEPQRLYQRLLAGDVEEATELANEHVEEHLPHKPDEAAITQALIGFYDDVAVPALRVATVNHVEIASAEQRLRVGRGMNDLLNELAEQYPPPAPDSATQTRGRVRCVGARWEVDSLAAAILTHVFARKGYDASQPVHPLSLLPAEDALVQAGDVDVICLSVFSPQPQARIRLIARKLRRRLPQVRIVVAAWNAGPELLLEDMQRRLGVDGIVSSVNELVLQMDLVLAKDSTAGEISVPVPEKDTERVQALRDSGAMAPDNEELVRDFARRAANAFVVKFAEVAWVDAEDVHKPGKLIWADADSIPRNEEISSWVIGRTDALVVPDTARDPRFAHNPRLLEKQVRFYAGAPLRDRDGHVLGVLSVMDDAPRSMSATELELLGELASDLMRDVYDRIAANAPA